jgi:hypothetical protein
MDPRTAVSMNGQLKAGATQELWRKLLPMAYALYQFPFPPSGHKLQELYCGDPGRGYHYVYEGQPDAAIFAPIAGVDGGGSPQRPTVQSMTPMVDDNLVYDRDRVVRQPLLDRLYSAPTFTDGSPNAGFAPDEMPSRVRFDVRNYDPNELRDRYDCTYGRGN